MAVDLFPIAHPLVNGGGVEWATEWGIDRDYGPFALLELPLHERVPKPVRQRWRFIPPGDFFMGSPPEETGRWPNEGPRHLVRLTRGFWMADTPCTQAFWMAVMGQKNNPSRFKDPERPVENVAWQDVQVFLDRLNELVPRLQATLPTEAQWEHACRAGSNSAIYPVEGQSGELEIFGERNAPALDRIAWYGGNSGVLFELNNGVDSSKWPEKQFPHTKAGTRRVRLKAPNSWGLYDMLGNVWEWCADGERPFTTDMTRDPRGPTDIGSRCVRGGGWGDRARNVRCAYRLQSASGLRNEGLGFRLVRVQDGS
jgi:formylglycine-generating enzyme required for sulfatase activity